MAGSDSVTTPAGRRKLRLLLLVGVPVVLIAVTATAYLLQRRYATTDNAYVHADKIQVSADIGGRVERVLVRENERVTVGELLLVINADDARLAVAQARAHRDTVRTEIASLKAQYAQKRAELDVAERNSHFASKELARQRELAARHLIAYSQLDSVEQAAEAAAGNVAVVRRDLESIAARLGGNPDVPADQHPDVRAAEVAIAQAELNLTHTELHSPRDGIVSHLPQAGDYLEAGRTALAIVAEKGMWVEANFKETDLGEVRVGQPVVVQIDTYGGEKWRGHVLSIAQATGSEFALLPSQNASGNWVKVVQRIPVRIALDSGPNRLPLRAGMSAYVKIDTQAPGPDAGGRAVLNAR
ncbi:MAG: HlyD family secretion protein [Steroidobacterales bacterium]